jgi:hypothetical protein
MCFRPTMALQLKDLLINYDLLDKGMSKMGVPIWTSPQW